MRTPARRSPEAAKTESAMEGITVAQGRAALADLRRARTAATQARADTSAALAEERRARTSRRAGGLLPSTGDPFARAGAFAR
jgi:hypothetical protein